LNPNLVFFHKFYSTSHSNICDLRFIKFLLTKENIWFAAGLDGSLEAVIKEGSAEVQVAQLEGESRLEVGEGSVKVLIGESDNYQLNLSAESVSVAEDFGAERRGENGRVEVRVEKGDKEGGKLSVAVQKGEISLEKSSWIASLNLKKRAA